MTSRLSSFLVEQGIDSLSLNLDVVLRTTAEILKIEQPHAALVAEKVA